MQQEDATPWNASSGAQLSYGPGRASSLVVRGKTPKAHSLMQAQAKYQNIKLN